MKASVYYIPNNHGVLITSDFTEIQKRMDIGIDPRIDYNKIAISDLGQFIIKGIGFDKVDEDSFQNVKQDFSNREFEYIAFHNSVADLSDILLDVNHLIVGENTKISITKNSFKNLKEITFLSVKTFNGKILDSIESVEKLIIWYENRKSNNLLPMFPNLKELSIYNGGIAELDLSLNPLLKTLQLHRCTKLEKVILNPQMQLTSVIVEACKKLDMSNLNSNINAA